MKRSQTKHAAQCTCLAELSGSESLGMMLFDTLVRSKRGVDNVTGALSWDRFLDISRALVSGDGRLCEGS
jgi:hypothetical protein